MKARAKILLTVASDDQRSGSDPGYPVGLFYIIAYLRNHVNAELEFRVAAETITDVMDDYAPDMVMISATSRCWRHAVRIAEQAKRRGAFTVIGGPHISALPDTLTPSMDVGVIGEGEVTAQEIVDVYLRGDSGRPDALAAIDGLAYWKEGQVQCTAPRALIKDLDTLPLPAREYLPPHITPYLISSRGCPYDCAFCFMKGVWKYYRSASAEYVFREIEDVYQRHGTTHIIFCDDLFVANRKRLRKLITMLRQAKLLQKLRFSVSCRANLVDEELVGLLQELRVTSVGMGLESFCQKSLAYLKGGNVTVEDNLRAVELLARHRISLYASFIIGCPDETNADVQQTYDAIKRSRIAMPDVYILTPLPGTRVWNDAEARGLVSKDMDFSKLDVSIRRGVDELVTVAGRMSKDDLIRWRDKFHRLRKINMIKYLWRTPVFFDMMKQEALNRLRGVLRIKPGKEQRAAR